MSVLAEEKKPGWQKTGFLNQYLRLCASPLLVRLVCPTYNFGEGIVQKTGFLRFPHRTGKMSVLRSRQYLFYIFMIPVGSNDSCLSLLAPTK